MKLSSTASLVGQRFGRLLVIEFSGNLNGRRRWLCRCDCGAYTKPSTGGLRTGDSQSCGCLAREKNRSRLKLQRTKHGMARTAEWRAWASLRSRCNNKNDQRYKNYGERGIKVCDEWSASFEAFYRDMGPKPSPKHSIDRINNDGDYKPSNCHWATAGEQARNTRQNVLFSMDGKTMTAAEWAREIGISCGALKMRLDAGWTIERALTVRDGRKEISEESRAVRAAGQQRRQLRARMSK